MSSPFGGSRALGVGHSVEAVSVGDGFGHPFEEVELGLSLLPADPSPDVEAVSARPLLLLPVAGAAAV